MELGTVIGSEVVTETSTMDTNLHVGSTVGTVSTVKCKPGQGKLNRLAATAQGAISANGHAAKRFSRDYNALVSTYVCPHCAATAIVTVNPPAGLSKISGSALSLKCSVVTS